MTGIGYSLGVEIGPSRVTLRHSGVVTLEGERPDVRPFAAAVDHDAWLISHLRARLSTWATANFPAAAAELDEVLPRLGARLAEAYLPVSIRRAIVALVTEAAQVGHVARIGLRLASSESLGALPWESLLLDGLDGPVALAPGVEFFRVESTPKSFFPEQAHAAPILLAAAYPRPVDSPGASLNAAEEDKLIRTMLLAPWAVIRAGYYLVDGSSDSIGINLQAGMAHIVHISTHGGETGVEVESARGYAITLSADALSKELRSAEHTPLLVFLSSCLSGSSSGRDELSLMESLVAAGVPAVIGMRVPVSDRYAHTFAGAFYANLVARNPTSVLTAFCDARRDMAYVWHQARDAGQAVVVSEWATPIILVREDVVFVDSGPGLGEPERVDLGATLNAVSRTPIQRQLRLAVLHPHDGLRAIYGVAGGGKTTEVGLAIESCRHVIGYQARIAGRASPAEFLAALAQALRSPDPRIASELRARASSLANELGTMDAESARERIEGLLAQHPDEPRFVVVWDAFEENLVPITGVPGPLDSPFRVRDTELLAMLAVFARRGDLIRLLIVSRYMFEGASGFNIGLMTRRQSDELIRLVGPRHLGAKDGIWRAMGGHPLGIRTIVEALERDPGRSLDEIIEETNGVLRKHAGLVARVAGLSTYARDLALHAAVFQVPVPTGALGWIMLSFGPNPDDATTARLKRLADIIGELDFVPGDVFLDWTSVEGIEPEIRSNLAADLELDPWLKLSRAGQLAAIHELLSSGLLAVDSGEASQDVLKVIAPRFVADHFARERPDETQAAHVRAMRYWLDPSNS